MREGIILSGALFVNLTAIFAIVAILLDFLENRKKKKKRKEFEKIALSYKKGDKEAELKLREQLLFLEKQVEKYTEKTKTAEEELERFKLIYQCFGISTEQDTTTVEIPSDTESLSLWRPNNERIYIPEDELEQFKIISANQQIHAKKKEKHKSVLEDSITLSAFESEKE